MPKTVKFLKETGWLELKGYNKIGSNSFPNILAMLSGQNSSESLRKCQVIDPKKQTDTCRLIWDDYKSKGYATAYAEDYPSISTFNHYKIGFVEQPTDYYLRPLLLAGNELLSMKQPNSCLGPELVLNRIFDYAKTFSTTFKKYSYFGFFWTNSFPFDDMNMKGAFDFSIVHFLEELSYIGTYDNTLVVLFSDHGMEQKINHDTFKSFENKLPFLFIWVPNWFKKQYPKKYKNLLINQNRLTTPYDVYLTLKDLIDENNEGKSEACPECRSLFKKVSWDRSCKDAAINKEYCMCRKDRPVNVTDPLVIALGKYLHQYIVNQTRKLLNESFLDERICAERSFSKVVGGYQNIDTAKRVSVFGDRKKYGEYVVIIESNPGSALFEAKIEVKGTENKRKFKVRVASSVNRLDRYANNSKCVNVVSLKYFCHCVPRPYFQLF